MTDSEAGARPSNTQPSMADIDIAVGGMDFSRRDLLLIATVADDLGMGTMLVTESTGRDSFAVLAEIAARTKRIGLGTGIVNVFSRTPTAIASATATVMETMGSRHFTLGLGTSGRQLMERYHGVPFARPVSRLAETVRVVDHIFRTGALPDGGDLFPLGGIDFGLRPPPRDQLSIHVAGLSDRTLDITGRYADGWLPIWVSAAHGAALTARVVEAARSAGRPKPLVSAVSYGGVGTSDSLVAHVRSTLAWYVAANGTAYRRLFERYGYVEEVEQVCRLWSAGDRAAARAAVPDHILRDTTLLGDPAEFFARVVRQREAGVDRPVLRIQGQLSAIEAVSMLGRLAAHTGDAGS